MSNLSSPGAPPVSLFHIPVSAISYQILSLDAGVSHLYRGLNKQRQEDKDLDRKIKRIENLLNVETPNLP